MERYSQHQSIPRAVRRSRAYRERMQRRRRRSIVAATGVSLAVALGMAFSLASFAGADFANAAVTGAKSLIDLMDQRSPGARTEAELTKTKQAKEALADRLPIVPTNLAEVLAPPVASLVPVDIGPSAPVIELASALPPGIILVPPASPPGGGIVTPPGGGIVTPPGGGVTPPGGGDTPPPGPPDTPPGPPPLPEPGTWMTMILGFGVVGWLLRRDKAAGRARVSA
ncbi:MAG: PEPxxWA-CTERM sorting domain-containing protein [Sphingomicrobium sp.]